MGDYYVNTYDQGTEEWLNARKGRITMSNAYAATGNSRFSTKDDIADESCKIKEKIFDEKQTKSMRRGSMMESIARKFYEDKTKNIVCEVGLGIRKALSPYIGGSPDGLVGDDGLIEIKNPDFMYQKVALQQRYRTLGIESENFDHIWPSHYAQMQGNMAIFGRKWCDYIVYVSSDDCIIERIPFDDIYWSNFLLPHLNKFVETFLIPRIEKFNIDVNFPVDI